MVPGEIPERLCVEALKQSTLQEARICVGARLLFCHYPNAMDILDEITHTEMKALIQLARREVPGFEIRFKTDSPYMKFLNVFAQLFNPTFMTRYTTAVGPKVYFPSKEELIQNAEVFVGVLAHEIVHMKESRERGMVPYFLSYAFPQILAALALLSFLAFWNIWFLLCLGFLLFLVPLPSPGRRDIELNGYEMSMSVNYWRTGVIAESEIDWYATQFSGPAYYFMWPWHAAIVNELKMRAIRVRTGENLQKPIFRSIHDLIKTSR